MKTQLAIVLVSIIVLQSCTQSAKTLKPTIADIPQRNIENLQPQVTFKFNDYTAINSYRELVTITPQGGEYGKETQRLADLELEASMDNKLSDDPQLIKRGEQDAQLAIQRYQQYLTTYPDRADNDLILYQLSRAYALESDADQSRQAMLQLVKAYPDSQYMDEVEFRLGEYYFVEGSYAKAETAYGRVVADYPESVFFEKSLYKYGWSKFKQNHYKGAIDSFVRLLDLKQQFIDQDHLVSTLKRADRELMEDVLRVVSLGFSYLPEKQPISQYFNHAGKRSYEPLLYRQLAALYLGKERITDATDVYLSFGDKYPFSPYTAEFHQQVIETYKKSGYVSLLLPEKKAFIQQYNIGSAYWKQQSAATQTALQTVLTGHLYDIATHYHATARASKKPADFKIAAHWYQRYLDSFPQDARAAEINFLLAESRFDAGQFQLAINEYEKTAYQYPQHKNSAEAGYAALIAYNKLFKQSNAKQQPLINEQLIQSSLKFSDHFTTDKRMPDVLLQTAEQFFELKKFALAKSTADRLLKQPQLKVQQAQTARVIIAHSDFELEDYAAAEKAYQAVLAGYPKKPGKADKKTTAIKQQLALSIYRQGEAERQLGNHQLAATHFLRVGKMVPGSPSKVIADYDAATEYMTLKQWPTAIVLLESFRKNYPRQKKWDKGVTEKLALAYNESAQPEKAAAEMLHLIKLTPKDKQQDLLWQAAELYHQAGDQSKAIANYKTYIKKYPQPIARSIELRYKIAEYYAQKKEIKKRYYWLNEIVKADARGKKQRTDRTRYLAAISSLELITPLRKKYSGAKLTIPLKKSLAVKKKLMKKTIDAYSKAAKYQVEEVTTASTYNIAEIYREFANALLTSERPAKLNADALEEYNYLLEDQAYPFEEKAISIHESNLSRIPAGSYDDSIKSSLKALGKLMPFRYAKTEVTEDHVE